MQLVNPYKKRDSTESLKGGRSGSNRRLPEPQSEFPKQRTHEASRANEFCFLNQLIEMVHALMLIILI